MKPPHTLAVALAIILGAGGIRAETPPPGSVDVEGLKRAAEREARSDSPEGCTELLTETTDACVAAATHGLEIDCKRLVIALEMSAKQASGALFDTGQAATNQRSGDAACRVHLKSLRRQRARAAEKAPGAGPVAPGCVEVGELLRRDCFPKLGSDGKLPTACHAVVSIFSKGPMRLTRTEPDQAQKCMSAMVAWKAAQPRP